SRFRPGTPMPSFAGSLTPATRLDFAGERRPQLYFAPGMTASLKGSTRRHPLGPSDSLRMTRSDCCESISVAFVRGSCGAGTLACAGVSSLRKQAPAGVPVPHGFGHFHLLRPRGLVQDDAD